ncbi:TetR/AcrR family transcriptional regulator [Psychrobacter sp. N25K4-3-2]|uniref:TetR/AcrR family transcriptional regulator n=1 Tax=Psychrobacter sp. N25K4-3-2 TaxID=2785026 RepID=UPI00188B28A6|nr:TetR/AcrR family transcriptional regulator [Psychrobacter sp. N25K4-3-2]MBF4488375.1 TetR/AcrR family transcriptional regulator [Psychrobacter sp. N25K4-3-2]
MDARTKILNAASELFLEGGGDALSVRAISKRAGLSTIGIYSHFQGKQGILDALYIEGFNLVRDAMNVIPDGKANKEQVLEACLGYLNVGEKYEAHYRLIFGESDAGYQPSIEAIAARDSAFSKLVRVAGSYLPDGAGIEERRQIALDIWAIVHGYVSISHHMVFTDDIKLDWKSMALRVVAVQLDAVDITKAKVKPF